MNKKTWMVTVLLAALLAPVMSQAESATLARGPYLQQATPDSVVVVWRTTGLSKPSVRFGVTPENLAETVAGEAITLLVSADVEAADDVPRLFQESASDAENRKGKGKDPSTPPNTYQYEAHITGLEPATRYHYAIYDDERLLAGGDSGHFFVSSPKPGTQANYRFWVVGDSGTGGKEQAMVHDEMLAFTAKTNRPLDFYLHVGDMAYGDGTDSQFQTNFFEPYKTTLRNTVCWPSMGNHEGHSSNGLTGVGPYYDAYVVPTAAEAGGAASGTEAYYSFDIADAHFVCLDSHDLDRDPAAPMAQWLRADLEQVDAKWLIAFWHHPAYSKGSHDSDTEPQLVEMRENFMPILEAAGVDLVLAGHSHIYERSMLIDGAYATPSTAEGVVLDDGDGNINGDGAYEKSAGLHAHEGTVAVVSGHGGAGMSRRGTIPFMRETILEHGSLIVDIQDDMLTGTMVDKLGATRDVFSLVKKGTVAPRKPLENPWKPEASLSQLSRFRLEFTDQEVGAAPKDWEVVSGDAGSLRIGGRENSKTRHLEVKAGDQDVLAKFADLTIDRFEMEALLRISEEGGKTVGVVFGMEDAKNMWVLLLDGATQKITVQHMVDGTITEVASAEAKIDPGKLLKLEMKSVRKDLIVTLGNDEVFRMRLDDVVQEGALGFIVGANSSAEFMRFDIKRD